MRSWYNLSAYTPSNGGKGARIKIHDEIGGWGVSARQFLNDLESFGDAQEIDIDINSPGGSVLEGWAIYNAIELHPAPVKIATISGIAASMASVIMLAAKEIRIPENGMIMVHRVTGGSAGTHEEMSKAAEMTKQMEDQIVAAYMKRTKLSENEIREMMNSLVGTWISGKDAVAKGFADTLMQPVQAINFLNEWKPLFTSLPVALFDTLVTSTANRSPDSRSMNITAVQKTRLKALLALTACNDAEKSELATLQALAAKDGYDAAAELAAEVAAEAAKKAKAQAAKKKQAAAKAKAKKAFEAAKAKWASFTKAKKPKAKDGDDDEDDQNADDEEDDEDENAADEEEEEEKEEEEEEEEEDDQNKALKARIAKLEKQLSAKDKSDKKAQAEAEKAALVARLDILENLVKSGVPGAAGGATGGKQPDNQNQQLTDRQRLAQGRAAAVAALAAKAGGK